ncbi:MAG: hypothetical protein KA163_00730 [Bacteroidia bacterium]|nr:hypothetical protein [Bacteroidia bacterium]
MNVAIFDLQHFEMVHVLHNVFTAPENNVHFFTNKNLVVKIQNSTLASAKFSSIVTNDFKNIDEFFKACIEHITKYNIEVIVFNTIDVHYKNTWDFIKQLKIPVFITIHNINTWLKPPFTLNKTALSYYYYRKKILAKTSGIILQEELFMDYVKTKTNYKKPLFALPHTLKEKETPLPKNQKLVVAIPGAIDGHRRDNDFSLSVIEKVNAKNKNIRFVFIGEIVGHLGERLYVKMQELNKKGCDILHYYDKNSNKVFDEQMSACDIVFLPLLVETKYEGITEIYGQTKVTGVLYDLMRFQKPCIVPQNLVIPPTMKDSVVSYKDENDFVDLVLKLESDRTSVTVLLNNAKQNSEYYTAEKIKGRFLDKFTALITKDSISLSK